MGRLIAIAAFVVGLAGPAGVPPAVADQNDPQLPALFALLEAARSPVEAHYAEQQIWQRWTESSDAEVNLLMRRAAILMQTGEYDHAIEVMDKVIAVAPAFAEGWNRRATIHYLRDDFDASVADIRKTLALEPRHFGALAGLGLIYTALEQPEGALKAYERVLEIHPQSPVARQRAEELREAVKGKAL